MQNKPGLKSQSAMEYLMTYGWAILIIAVVLGALYYLGIFGSATSGPRAQPGSCQVIRPLGPGTTSYINLEGVCTGLLPQFVGSFDGVSSRVQLPVKPTGAYTISFWFYPYALPTTAGSYNAIFGGLGLSSANARGGVAFTYWYNNNDWEYDTYNAVTRTMTSVPGSKIPVNSWTFVTLTWDGTAGANAKSAYVNGGFVLSGSGLTGPIDWSSYNFYFGYGYTGSHYFNGQITNVQIYNTSLDASAIQSLYAEGIGGAPIPSPYLVGWWPLNGNANDYSGNNNNGVPTNAVYTSSWTK